MFSALAMVTMNIMFVLAVTGGLGAGKSTASAHFRACGAATIDLDFIAATLLAPGCSTLDEVVVAFGPSILNGDGTLNRAALAALAFEDWESVRRLNTIVHPAVARELGPAIVEVRLMPNQPHVVVIEVPLIVEAPVFGQVADEILAIAAPEELRVKRAMRRGLDEKEARRRIAVQATDEERSAIANETIVNDGTKEQFEARLCEYWDRRILRREVDREAQ